LTKEDDHRAIELLLSIASDYSRSTEGTPTLALPPRWFIISFIFSLIACIALSFPVNTAIGIGKGKKILARRRMWLSSQYGVFILFFVLAVGGSFLATALYEYVTK
jgi:choline-glycine betaine transporter